VVALFSFSEKALADDGDKKTLRYFMSTGEVIDFDASRIDSITSTVDQLHLWIGNFCQTFIVEDIDSVWYMSSTLRLSTPSIDFGKVAIGSKKRSGVSVTNTGLYPETYRVFADGIFSAKWSGIDITIGAGQTLDLDVTFSPLQTIKYTGSLSLLSSAADKGEMQLFFIGEGVSDDSEEQDVDQTPVEQDVEILLPEDVVTDNFLDGFKIANFNGDYPVELHASARGARKVRRNNTYYYNFPATAYVSPVGLQTHFLTDKNDNPYLETVSLPGQKVTFSFENEAIALLMRLPDFMTSNQTEYNNAVTIIKKLKSFPDFVVQVRTAFYEGKTRGLPPDYNNLNTSPIINELLNMNSDNREMTFSGVTLTHVNTNPQSASFRLHNDFRRTIHAYPQRVKMNDANLVVVGTEEAAPTYKEKFEELLDAGIEQIKKWQGMAEDLQAETYEEIVDKIESLGLSLDLEALNVELDHEDLEFLEIHRESLIRLEENLLKKYPALGKLASLHAPYALETVNSDYRDMVGDGWDAWVYGIGKESSVFEAETGTIEVPYKDYDKIFVNVFGMGANVTSFTDLPQIEQLRFIKVLLASGYHDYIEPLCNTITGIKKIYDLGDTNYKFDFRYGKQKYPEWALLAKLFNAFMSKISNITELGNNIDKKDFKAIGKQLHKFILDELRKIPDEIVLEKNAKAEDKEKYRESKRTYVNLIYNIYKKWSGNRSTSEAFRNKFKKEANKWLAHVNIVYKTMDTAESGVDLLGAMQGFKDSKLKETFVLDKSDKPYIYIKEPTTTFLTPDVTAHFEWETFQGKGYGEYVYDLELMTETADGVSQTVVKNNITTTSCDYHISELASARDALKVYFRIVARSKKNTSSILSYTEFMPLVHRATMQPPEMVDLGLPSGTLWAVTNLGATVSTDPGNYYAWAETTGYDEGKTTFSWKNYSYCNGTNNSLTKYCSKRSYGRVDNITLLDGNDDMFKKGCGNQYSIPTKEDWEELLMQCTWMWFVDGKFVIVRGPNNNTITLPMAGYRSGQDLYDNGTDGYYWSSTLDKESPDDAWFMHVKNSKGVPRQIYSYYRSQGRSIRPVKHSVKIVPPAQ
jgi:hypothetical protein